jgi:hypothetical protein
MLNRRLLMLASLVLLQRTAKADVQVLYPDNNASGTGKKIILFEARKGKIESGSSGPVGHTFVKLGTELDDGLEYIHGVFGYYPDHGKLYEIKLIVGTAAVVKFELPADMQVDISQKYYVSEESYSKLLDMAKTYLSDNPTYSLLTGSNCVKFVAEMAKAAGLSISDPSAFTFPGEMIESIQKANGTDPKALTPNQNSNAPATKPKEAKKDLAGSEPDEPGQVRIEKTQDWRGGNDGPLIPDGVPIVRGGLVPDNGSVGGGGSIGFGWPTVKFKQLPR